MAAIAAEDTTNPGGRGNRSGVGSWRPLAFKEVVVWTEDKKSVSKTRRQAGVTLSSPLPGSSPSQASLLWDSPPDVPSNLVIWHLESPGSISTQTCVFGEVHTLPHL